MMHSPVKLLFWENHFDLSVCTKTSLRALDVSLSKTYSQFFVDAVEMEPYKFKNEKSTHTKHEEHTHPKLSCVQLVGKELR